MTHDSGLRTQDSGLRTQDSGLRTQDSGLRLGLDTGDSDSDSRFEDSTTSLPRTIHYSKENFYIVSPQIVLPCNTTSVT